MSSKSSHEATVAQVSCNRTSANGNAIRQASRSSESQEKWLNSSATRALEHPRRRKSRPYRPSGASSRFGAPIETMTLRQGQIGVNLSSLPWAWKD
jgi:hypothetical protein